MPRTFAQVGVTSEKLRLSRAPHAELAAAATQAQEDAGLEEADFIIVAIDPDSSEGAVDAIAAALEKD